MNEMNWVKVRSINLGFMIRENLRNPVKVSMENPDYLAIKRGCPVDSPFNGIQPIFM